MDLRSRAGGTVPAVMTFGDYESELKLTAAPANPYQYFRSEAGIEKTDEWNNGTDLALADAIEKSIAASFPRGPVCFHECVDDGGGGGGGADALFRHRRIFGAPAERRTL